MHETPGSQDPHAQATRFARLRQFFQTEGAGRAATAAAGILTFAASAIAAFIDVERYGDTAKLVLSILIAVLSAVVGFYFGSKSNNSGKED